MPEPSAALADAVERAASEALGGHFRIVGRRALHGDGAATAARLQGPDGRFLFLKTTPAARLDDLLAERDGLEALARPGVLRVPAVLAAGTADEFAFLLTEHIRLGPLNGQAAARMGHLVGAFWIICLIEAMN